MRFLRRQTHNRRAVFDNNLYVDTTNAVVMGGRNNLTLPSGGSSDYPVAPTNGMIRYNNGAYDAVSNPNGGQVEVYQGYTWRALRYKEPGAITVQTVGYGDASTVYFGPLNPAPPAVAQSGYSWTGANLIVLVENVFQIFNTNYTIETNPSIAGVTYNVSTATGTALGAQTIQIDTSIVTIYPSVNLVGASITGSPNLQNSTTITSYSVNASGQLNSVQISLPTVTGIIPATAALTITVATATASGSYLHFSSPVPYGKPAIVLSGFDS